MRWLLVLAAPLLSYRPGSLGIFSFFPPFLLIPLAALLGRRLGAAGVAATAIGGLPFIITLYSPWGAVGGSPALYAVALAVAAIAASPRPLAEVLRWPQSERAAGWLALGAPFLLVLYVGATLLEAPSLEISFNFGFGLIGYLLLFLLGARGVRFAPVAAGLAAAALLSWVLAWAMAGQSPGFLDLRVSPMQPAVALAALAMFSAGSATGASLAGRALPAIWQRPWLPLVLLLFLWFGPPPIGGFQVDLPFVRRISFLEVYAALPLAGFMAGRLRGARGTIAITALVAGVLLAWLLVAMAIGRAGPHFSLGMIAIEAPFVAAAFAAMGARAAPAPR